MIPPPNQHVNFGPGMSRVRVVGMMKNGPRWTNTHATNISSDSPGIYTKNS